MNKMLYKDYRAWNKRENKYELHIQQCLKDPQNPWDCYRCFFDYLNNRDMEVEQSIGLLDAHGRDIYEGDLVRGILVGHFKFEGKIIRHKNMFVVELDDKVLLSQLGKYHIEIIGNVHQGKRKRITKKKGKE